jgi:hypothetical protein
MVLDYYSLKEQPCCPKELLQRVLRDLGVIDDVD